MSIEVKCGPKLFGYQHPLLWVNDEYMLILGWTITISGQKASVKASHLIRCLSNPLSGGKICCRSVHTNLCQACLFTPSADKIKIYPIIWKHRKGIICWMTWQHSKQELRCYKMPQEPFWLIGSRKNFNISRTFLFHKRFFVVLKVLLGYKKGIINGSLGNLKLMWSNLSDNLCCYCLFGYSLKMITFYSINQCLIYFSLSLVLSVLISLFKHWFVIIENTSIGTGVNTNLD